MSCLTADQLEDYERNGFLFLPGRFSEPEVAVMRRELPAIYAEDTPRNRLVPGMVRTVRAPHTSSDVFRALARHPRVVEPARQLLRSDVYVHQFKINAKLPFSREVAPWHQEFKLWHQSDGMPTSRATIAAVFLDEVTEFNGPLIFMAGSQKEGLIDHPPDDTVFGPALAWLRYHLDLRTAARLATRYRLVAPKGPAGSVVFFHATTVHGSVPSMSPSRRDLALIAFNSIENSLLPVERPRPVYSASRTFEPVECCADHALVRLSASPSGFEPRAPERLS